MDKFSKRIKELRKLNNFTQTEIANKLSITLRQYQKYENGEVKPKYETLIKLSLIYNISLDYITGLKD